MQTFTAKLLIINSAAVVGGATKKAKHRCFFVRHQNPSADRTWHPLKWNLLNEILPSDLVPLWWHQSVSRWLRLADIREQSEQWTQGSSAFLHHTSVSHLWCLSSILCLTIEKSCWTLDNRLFGGSTFNSAQTVKCEIQTGFPEFFWTTGKSLKLRQQLQTFKCCFFNRNESLLSI